MFVYSVIIHAQPATCNVFLATSFDSKIQPSSGHHTRTKETENLCIITMETSSFTLKDIVKIYTKRRQYLHMLSKQCIKKWTTLQQILKSKLFSGRLLGLQVRFPPGAWMFVPFEYCDVRQRSLRLADHSSSGVLPTDCGVSNKRDSEGQYPESGRSTTGKTTCLYFAQTTCIDKHYMLYIHLQCLS